MANTTIPVELSSTPGIVDNSNATAITIDSSENVGIGVTPEAFWSGFTALRLGDTGGLFNRNDTNSLYLSQNMYIESSGSANPTYIENDEASWYIQSAGNHIFLNAPAGTGTISGTERLRIDSSGNVGIGTSSPLAKNHITGSGTSGQVTASWILQNNSSGTAGMDITGAAGASRLRFVYGGGPGTGTNSLTEAMCIGTEGTYAGNVGIGATGPAKSLHIKTPSATAATLRLDTGGAGSDVWDVFSTTAGRLYINAPAYGNGVYIQHSATSWTSNSDETLKENITSLGTVGDKLKNYRTSYFNWINDQRETPERQIGFIAQDWETDFPEVVNKVEGEPLGMQYTETIPILLKYIQELEARLETLENA